MRKALIGSALILGASSALTVLEPVSAAEPCAFSTQRISGRNITVNNCPPISGVFQNGRWQVRFGLAAGEFLYIGTDRRTGSAIELYSREMRGNTRRPVYVFRNRNTTYTVTYQTNDQDTIRLEVFQGGRRQLNQLLTRVSN